MKTLLVTGGSGFIGSHFMRLFLKDHPDGKILNLDKLTYCGNPENNRDLEKTGRYEFIHGDICDVSLVASLMEKSDGVVHFAAETHVDRSIDSADLFLMTNIIGTKTLLEAARRSEIKRFVHISTDEVYGSLATGSAKEDSPLLPNSPYSASKASADLMVRAYRETYDLPVIIVRSTNNFGPNQFPEKVIPLFVTHLMEGKKVPLYGKGDNRRDWIYVEDNCQAIALAFDKGEPGSIYNIGAGNEISNLELTNAILRLMGKGSECIENVTDRLGHDFRYSVDSNKIKKLGYQAKWTFEAALKQTIEWYRKNPEWWKPLKKDKFTIK